MDTRKILDNQIRKYNQFADKNNTEDIRRLQDICLAILKYCSGSENKLEKLGAGWMRFKFGDESAISIFEELLNSFEYNDDVVARELVISMLGETKSEMAVPLLKKLLKSKNDREKTSAIYSLGSLHQESTLPIFEKLIEDKDWRVKIAAIAGLKWSGLTSALPMIKNALEEAMSIYRTDDYKKVMDNIHKKKKMTATTKKEEFYGKVNLAIFNAIEALAKLGNEKTVCYLRRILKEFDKDTTFYITTAMSLGELGDKSIIPILKDILESEEGEIYFLEISEILWKLGEDLDLSRLTYSDLLEIGVFKKMAKTQGMKKSAISYLQCCIERGPPGLRNHAVSSLGKIDDDASINLLKGYLENPDLRDNAVFSLYRIAKKRKDNSIISLLRKHLKRDNGEFNFGIVSAILSWVSV